MEMGCSNFSVQMRRSGGEYAVIESISICRGIRFQEVACTPTTFVSGTRKLP